MSSEKIGKERGEGEFKRGLTSPLSLKNTPLSLSKERG
jgi:hypothetical protein